MATLPSPTQIAGPHGIIYEAYYNVVDPKGVGSIGGMEAARFLKKSGLSDVILSKIWDLSDPGGRGCLDKTGMYIALKLVALVQNGKELNVKNVHTIDVPPPKMGDVPLPRPQKPPPTPLITSLPPSVDWSIKSTERIEYEKLFESLQPINGLIAGNKVKNVLMESKLPVEILGKIWDLADQDKDGMLDKYEFLAAMHLVYKALDKYAIPNTLPVELMPPSRRKTSQSSIKDGLLIKHEPSAPLISNKPIVPTVPVAPPTAVPPPINWVVTNEEKTKSDALFIKSDIDKDGFVSGQEIKDVFLQSGVPQQILAHIWALCDIKQSGKLNNEQFALAMWLVARCLKGIDPPPTLAPEMVPPSFRTVVKSEGVSENNNTKYANPELEMISKDIEQLSKERLSLETEIAQKEADIRIKKSEITSLQSELDTLAATLKQLENQRGEAQKRLNDLKAQTREHELTLVKYSEEIAEKLLGVDKLRVQAAEQAATVAAQESELNTKKQQLEGLKQEEDRMSKELSETTSTFEKLTNSMQESQLNISQAKALQTQLEEQSRQLSDAIKSCDSAITSNDPSLITDTLLRISPDFRDAKIANARLVNGTTNNENYGSADDPFSDSNRGFDKDPFQNDPFNSKNGGFGSSDAFQATFGTTIQDGFSSDPFGGSSEKSGADPFDAFGDSKAPSSATPQDFDKDPFGCDPFAILHAPTRDGSAPPVRPTSPSPALPPKKSKQPPPRPAPPRPQPPKKNDPFGGDSFGTHHSGFADFSDFDAKLSKATTTTTTSQITKPADGSKGLEFVEDPFRDYRYEDPFNISFEENDEKESASIRNVNNNSNNNWIKSKSVDAFNTPPSLGNNDNDEINRNNNGNGFEDKFDPFDLDGRQSAPPTTPKKTNDNKRNVLSEDQQLAWAAAESLKLEKERKARVLQEEAELKLAISLSRAETKKH